MPAEILGTNTRRPSIRPGELGSLAERVRRPRQPIERFEQFSSAVDNLRLIVEHFERLKAERLNAERVSGKKLGYYSQAAFTNCAGGKLSSARALWFLGFPDQALADATDVAVHCDAGTDFVYAHTWLSQLVFDPGDYRRAAELAQAAIDESERQELLSSSRSLPLIILGDDSDRFVRGIHRRLRDTGSRDGAIPPRRDRPLITSPLLRCRFSHQGVWRATSVAPGARPEAQHTAGGDGDMLRLSTKTLPLRSPRTRAARPREIAAKSVELRHSPRGYPASY